MSAEHVVVSFTTCFSGLTDPRVARTRLHDLMDLLVIAICGTICGCESWEELPRYGRAKKDWLRKYCRLRNGIPSADTFARVFQRLNPDEFVRCFGEWVQALRKATEGEVIAIDGKQARRSGHPLKGWTPLHLVSAWATENRLVLGCVACDDKSNEITAVPKLLRLLEITGAIVTLDALGCQKEIAQTVLERGADYVLTVKGNQPQLQQQIARAFEQAFEQRLTGQEAPLKEHVTREKGHGREEERCYYVLPAPEELRHSSEWPRVGSIGFVVRRRIIRGREELESQYYVSSLSPLVRRFAQAVRKHWTVENQLHWSLDVQFAEDTSRVRKGFSGQIAALLRRLALNVLRQDTTVDKTIIGRRKKAGWNNDILETLLLNCQRV